jgi:hypothetical protein
MHQIERGIFERTPVRAKAMVGGSDGLTRRYVHGKVHSAGHWLHVTLEGALPRG